MKINCKLAARGALAIVAFALAAGGCKKHGASGGAASSSSSGTPGIEGAEILIGEYGSMTGAEATFGQSTHNGLTMAAAEINAAGGIEIAGVAKKVRVVSYDDQGKTSEVGTAVTRLITSDNVLAVVGEVASSLSIAGGQVCQQHGVPMISPSSTHPQVTETGNYIFRICFIDPFQGYVMAKFLTDAPAAHGLGLKKVAVLVDQRQAYAQGLSRDFVSALGKLGGTVVATEKYQGGDQDFSAQLTGIKAAAPEAIYIPGYYTDIANIAKQVRAMGITATLLGGDGWESVTDIGGPALDGAYYSNHYAAEDPRPETQQFVARYKALYNKTPDSIAALGYDAMMLIKDAIGRVQKDGGAVSRTALRDALARTADWSGVTGKVSMDAQRNARKPAVVLRINAAEKRAVFQTSIDPQ